LNTEQDPEVERKANVIIPFQSKIFLFGRSKFSNRKIFLQKRARTTAARVLKEAQTCSAPAVLLIRIRDPVLFYPWSRDPGWKKSGSGNEHPGAYFRELRNNFSVKK
jgi:hypothetical protein